MELSESRLTRFPFGRRGADEVEIFVAAIRRLSRAQSLEEIMAVAASAARNLLDADGVTFVLKDGDLCHYADEDAISPLWKGKRFPLDSCISGWCMIHRRATAIPDVYQDDRIPPDAYRPTFVRSLAMVPVNKESPVGAMGAYWARKRRPVSEELDLLQTMADAASLALAYVQLHQRDVSAELVKQDHAHRIKNIFTLALALVGQTRGENVAEYKHALKGRLEALEGAHAVMFEAKTGLVDLHAMLTRLLSPYAAAGQLTLDCDAQRLRMSDQDATDVAMIINELASNATKYGALSVPHGRLSVTCRNEASELRLSWREADGPQVNPPTQIGFGSKLIRSLVENYRGEADLRYPPEGFECDMILPIGQG